MGSLIGGLLGFFLIIFAIFLIAVINIAVRVRNFMSRFSSGNESAQSTQSAREKQRKSSGGSAPRNETGHRKVFEDSEGEYVDFEEIK